MSTTTPRASQRYSAQTSASTSSAGLHNSSAAGMPDARTAASYSFAGGGGGGDGGGLPPAFTSRRTTSSVLSSTASSAHQAALFSTATHSAGQRNTFPTAAAAAAGMMQRQASTTSTPGSGLAGRIASFASTSTATPGDEAANTSYSSTTMGQTRAVPDIVDRARDKTRQAEVNLSSLSFLFSEMVNYTQNRVTGVTELERRLALIGYTMGQRILALSMHRQEMTSNPKNPKREARLLPTLLWIHTVFWKAAFGKPADSLERSTEQGRADEYMISTNTPVFGRSICVPTDMSQLSVEAITAGMVEAALDGLGFPARVTAHTVASEQWPNRTTILIKLDRAVMEREEALAAA